MIRVKNNLLISVIILITCNPLQAQDTAFTLDKNEFISIVKKYHPVVKQAGFKVARSKAELLESKGIFDPVISSSLDRKNFDDKLYYSYFNPQLTIPLWYGIDVKAGTEEVVGNRVNAEETLGKISYVGIKVPANKLLFDSRRATLKQASIAQQLTEAERSLIINDVLFDALSAYWNWVKEYRVYKIFNDAILVNETRFRFVKTEFEQGLRPAIDTTEALVQLQNFYLQQNEAWLSFQKAGLELSNFLWQENNTPMPWNDAVVPAAADSTLPSPALEQMLQQASNHPKLKMITGKQQTLQLEKKIKAQYLLPQLNVNANVLSKGYSLPKLSSPIFENNYKLGFELNIPMFFRQARGAYQSVKFKLQENEQDRLQTTLELQNKIRSYFNELLAIKKQIAINEDLLRNADKLLKGEKVRFDIGESTLFLVNVRENKVLEVTQKLWELKTKWHKSFAGLYWASGLLN